MHERILRCICTAFDLAPESVGEHTSQADIDDWDSIGTIRLVLCLEEEFGVSISPESARRMISVSDIANELRGLGVSTAADPGS